MQWCQWHEWMNILPWTHEPWNWRSGTILPGVTRRCCWNVERKVVAAWRLDLSIKHYIDLWIVCIWHLSECQLACLFQCDANLQRWRLHVKGHIMCISAMMRETNCNAEEGRLQGQRYWGRKGFSQRRQAENLFQVLAFHVLKTFQGAVEVTDGFASLVLVFKVWILDLCSQFAMETWDTWPSYSSSVNKWGYVCDDACFWRLCTVGGCINMLFVPGWLQQWSSSADL